MAVLVIFAGCAAPDRAGCLLIIGGGLHDDNAAVPERFFQHVGSDDAIGVLPTASGIAAESGAATIQSLSPHGRRNWVGLINLTESNPGWADSETIANQIDKCGGLWFTGGDQARIAGVFRRGGADTLAYKAVRRLLARGGVVAGTSAGAAMMCDPMIYGGDGDSALRMGAVRRSDADVRASSGPATSQEDSDGSVVFGLGMGFFPYGIVDQHFLNRNRLGRLIVALHATGSKYGYGVNENCALWVDLGSHRLQVMGEHGVVLVDLTEARLEDRDWSNVRLSLLTDGDAIDGQTGKVLPRSDRSPAAPTASAPAMRPDGESSSRKPPRMMTVIQSLAAPETSRSRVSSHGIEWTFSRDEGTRIIRPITPSEPAIGSISILNIRCDIRLTEAARP